MSSSINDKATSVSTAAFHHRIITADNNAVSSVDVTMIMATVFNGCTSESESDFDLHLDTVFDDFTITNMTALYILPSAGITKTTTLFTLSSYDIGSSSSDVYNISLSTVIDTDNILNYDHCHYKLMVVY